MTTMNSGWWCWLVVDLPLWKMMEWRSVGMMTFPTEWKIKVMFQTTNQLWSIQWMDLPGRNHGHRWLFSVLLSIRFQETEVFVINWLGLRKILEVAVEGKCSLHLIPKVQSDAFTGLVEYEKLQLDSKHQFVTGELFKELINHSEDGMSPYRHIYIYT